MGDRRWMVGHRWRATESVILRHCWWLWEANGAKGVGGARRARWMAWNWERMWGRERSIGSGRGGTLQCATRVFCRGTCSWAHAFLRQKSCLHAWRVPYRHWRARFQTFLRLVSRQSRRSCSRLYSRSYRRVRSHCRSHSSPARPVRSWGWRRGSGSARRRAGRRRVSCTGRGCRRA